MTKPLQLGFIGATLRFTIENESGNAPDISTATVKQIKIAKPSGTVMTKTAAFVTDGTDGQIQYVTIANDLNEPGVYQAQAYVEYAGIKGHTEPLVFSVRANLS